MRRAGRLALVALLALAACGPGASDAADPDTEGDGGPTVLGALDVSDGPDPIVPALTACGAAEDPPCPEDLPICGPDGHCIGCEGDGDCGFPYLRCHRDVCVPRTCTPGGGWCGIAEVLFCRGDGLTWDAEPCAKCDDGECTACGPGPAACLGHAVLQCRDDQSGFDVLETCPDAWACDQDTCVACVPGSTRCDGDLAQTCADDATWDAGTDCAAGFTTCVDGACTPCEPGATRCVGGIGQTCSADGLWVAGDDCWDQGLACRADATCVSPCHVPELGDAADDGCDFWAVDLDQADPETYHPLSAGEPLTGADDEAFGVKIANLGDDPISAWIFLDHALTQTVQIPGRDVALVPLEGGPSLVHSARGLPAWGIRVSGPAVVTQHNPLGTPATPSKEGATLLPAAALGVDHRALLFPSNPGLFAHVTVVATIPETTVSFELTTQVEGSEDLAGLVPGQDAEYVLDAGEILTLEAPEDFEIELTGTRVVSPLTDSSTNGGAGCPTSAAPELPSSGSGITGT